MFDGNASHWNDRADTTLSVRAADSADLIVEAITERKAAGGDLHHLMELAVFRDRDSRKPLRKCRVLLKPEHGQIKICLDDSIADTDLLHKNICALRTAVEQNRGRLDIFHVDRLRRLAVRYRLHQF